MLEELLLVNPNNISLADGSHSWDQQLGAEGTASLAGRGLLGGTAAAWRLGASGVGPSKGCVASVLLLPAVTCWVELTASETGR